MTAAATAGPRRSKIARAKRRNTAGSKRSSGRQQAMSKSPRKATTRIPEAFPPDFFRFGPEFEWIIGCFRIRDFKIRRLHRLRRFRFRTSADRQERKETAVLMVSSTHVTCESP